jgi:2'-5' RNA ligase
MDGQQSRFGEGPRRPFDVSSQERFYFAIRPGYEATRRMAAVGEQFIRENRLSGHLRPLHTFHVSVLGVGFYQRLSRDEIATAEAAARAIAFKPFSLTFMQAVSYRKRNGRNPFVLASAEGAEQVNELAATLAAAMVTRGFRPRGKIGGQPHLTLLYDHVLVPETRLNTPIELEVPGFFLVRNHHGQGRHENQLFTFRS